MRRAGRIRSLRHGRIRAEAANSIPTATYGHREARASLCPSVIPSWPLGVVALRGEAIGRSLLGAAARAAGRRLLLWRKARAEKKPTPADAGSGHNQIDHLSERESRVPALRISAPKGSLVLLVIFDYPSDYEYETDWYQ